MSGSSSGSSLPPPPATEGRTTPKTSSFIFSLTPSPATSVTFRFCTADFVLIILKMGSASGLVIGISLVLYTVAFGLALGAMARRSKGDLTVVDESMGTLKCHYSTDIATGLAAGAFVFLLVAQMFVMFVTRCFCCGNGYKPGGARTIAALMCILSWICFVVASAALVAGASQNKVQTRGLFASTGPNVTCRQVQRSLFAAASAFTFITAVCTDIYYVLLCRTFAPTPDAWHSYHGGPSVGVAAYT